MRRCLLEDLTQISKMELDTIIKTIKLCCEQNEIKPSDDMILDCATRIWSTKFINTAKNGGSASVGATEKQKETLKKFYINFGEGISKKDASDLISKKIESLKD